MDTLERQSVRKALDSLKPFLEAYLVQRRVSLESALPGKQSSGPDIQALLKACVSNWDAVLSRELPRVARSYIHELLDVSNRWAHEAPFTASEAARAVDTARVFGAIVGAPAPEAQTAPRPAKLVSPKSAGGETQREAMVRIFASVNRDEDRAIREYAAAERCGEVARRRNKHGIDPEAYARALLKDGLKKGWLPKA